VARVALSLDGVEHLAGDVPGRVVAGEARVAELLDPGLPARAASFIASRSRYST
jgi:hypothetical protein